MRDAPLVLSLLVVLAAPLGAARGAERADARPFGLERRVPWTTSRVSGTPEPPPPYRTEPIFPKLKITQPLTFEIEPGTNDYLVIQHLGGWAPPGKVLRVADDPEVDRFDIVLETSGIAYGLDFHPDYVRNGHLFLGHNISVGGKARTRVSRFTVDRKPPHKVDPKSELVIIDWESDGHNGGDIAFGADGMLYITSGDGTGDSDGNNRGQDLAHLTSKVLRIDVDHPDPGRAYSVPGDNPFVKVPGARPETWAYGLRNPWRLTFDRPSGQLWCGNNGQDLWETAYLVAKGANYGWSAYEGSHPFLGSRKLLGPAPLTPPTVEHHHSEARSLSGGVVYRGDRLPELEGAYVYGDYSTGKIWAVKHDGTRVAWHKEIADTTFQITGFGLDRHGNLVVIDHQTGFHRLVPRPSAEVAPRFPTRLSETGLFATTRGRVPDPALIPYSVNAPLWSDGAAKERFLAVPGAEKVGFNEGASWGFPNGTVLVKTFLLDVVRDGSPARLPVETRLLTRQDNEWVGYSYAWDDDLGDASLVRKEGMDRTFEVRDPDAPGGRRSQAWHYPSRAECMVCHSRAANYVLGLTGSQMNRDHDYGKVVDNQLRTLEHIGLFADPLPKRPEELAKLADPYDPHAGIDRRIRSYFQSNCAHCHGPAGGGNAAIDLGFGAPPEALGVNALPQQGTLGIEDARILVPGDPTRSTLFQRVSRRGQGQMPPVASSVVDQDAVKLLREWIETLQPPAPPADAKR